MKQKNVTNAKESVTSTRRNSTSSFGNRNLRLLRTVFFIALILAFTQIPSGFCSTVSVLKKVGQLDGTPQNLTINGDTLLASMGSQLLIFDITNPMPPALKGSIMLPTVIKKIQCANQRVYILDNLNGLWAIDITDPATPSILGHYENVPQAQDLAITGNFAYLAWRSGLGIVDSSDPSQMLLAGVWMADGRVLNVFSYNNLLYVNLVGKMEVLEGSAAPSLYVVSTVNTAEIAQNIGGIPPELAAYAEASVVFVQGNSMLLQLTIPMGNPSVSPESFQVVCDITDPYHPRVVGKVNGGELSVVNNGIGAGSKASCVPRAGCFGSVVTFYHVDSLENISEYYTYNHDFIINSMAMKDSYLYLADATGIFIVDAEHPNSLAPLWSMAKESFWDISGSQLDDLVLACSRGLRTINLTQPEQIELGPLFARAISPDDCLVYEAPYTYLIKNIPESQEAIMWVLDLPNEIATTRFQGIVRDAAIYQNKIYLAMEEGGLGIMDVTVPSAPRNLPGLEPQNWSAYALAIKNGYAYVAAGENGLKVVDVHGLYPTELETIDFPEPVQAVATAENYLYVATDLDVFQYDISQPLNPKYIKVFHSDRDIQRLSAAGQMVFVMSNGSINMLKDMTIARESLPGAELPRLSVVTGDFDKDGKADILRYDPDTLEAKVFLAGDNGFVPSDTLVISGLPKPDVCTAGDFNGDGYYDVLWHSPEDNTLKVYLSDGTNFTQSGTLIIGSLGPANAYLIGDFDHNGKDDVMWFEDWLGKATFFMSDGNFFSASVFSLELEHPDALTSGNFDNQAGDDIMWYTLSNLEADFYLSMGNIFYRWDRMAFKGFGLPDRYGVGDFNGDGLDDIVWYESWNQTLQIFASHKEYFAPEPGLTLYDMPLPAYIACGDFDGNGKADLLWGITKEGIAQAWLSDGNTFTRQPSYDVKLF